MGFKPQILVITHNCVMNLLMGKKMESGKIVGKINFLHCHPVQVSLADVRVENRKIMSRL